MYDGNSSELTFIVMIVRSSVVINRLGLFISRFTFCLCNYLLFEVAKILINLVSCCFN